MDLQNKDRVRVEIAYFCDSAKVTYIYVCPSVSRSVCRLSGTIENFLKIVKKGIVSANNFTAAALVIL